MKKRQYIRPEHEDISKEMWEKIDAIIEKYKDVAGSTIAALRESQDVVGYLPKPLIDYISRGLNVPSSQVFGVTSFYSLFSLVPRGRHTVKVCTGTACYVKGIKEVLSRISNEYNLEEGGTTEDRRFSLLSVRCLGACGLAPVMTVDEKTYGSVKPDNVLEILNNYE